MSLIVMTMLTRRSSCNKLRCSNFLCEDLFVLPGCMIAFCCGKFSKPDSGIPPHMCSEFDAVASPPTLRKTQWATKLHSLPRKADPIEMLVLNCPSKDLQLWRAELLQYIGVD